VSWTYLDTGIVVLAAVSAMSCALIGSFLVLRRMSMMGDAISHAVLPGIAAAFLVTLSRDTAVILIGAAFAGVLTAAFTQLIHQAGNVDRGAAMGVVFTTMFAVGLILIVRSADSVHIDVHTVFYGAVELAPLNDVVVMGVRVPRALLILGAVFAADLAFVLLLFKELNLTSFDAEFARAVGFNSRLVHYALMVMVAVTIVAAFESVGSILVIAMLIVPGVVAGLFTKRLWSLLMFGQVVALVCALGGHLTAITVPRWFGLSDTSTAGMMTVVAGLVVAVALVVAPERGLAARALHRVRVALAVGREDLLVELLRVEERAGQAPERRELVREEPSRIVGRSTRFDRTLALLVERLRRRVRRDGTGYRLTGAGRLLATGLLRNHRLWERYLFAEGNTAVSEVHFAAHQLEHVTSPGMRADLARTAGAATDPHGRPIPGAADDDASTRPAARSNPAVPDADPPGHPPTGA
jgi:manganese/zinc/iron transport system permease protein